MVLTRWTKTPLNYVCVAEFPDSDLFCRSSAL
jgi:hypothetical protein